ncbi:hypothetical protein FCOIX_12880 [Fusarium coicis]|nr:hypothetical protein FCOIX_12880 [Fusarium coicis]
MTEMGDLILDTKLRGEIYLKAFYRLCMSQYNTTVHPRVEVTDRNAVLFDTLHDFIFLKGKTKATVAFFITILTNSAADGYSDVISLDAGLKCIDPNVRNGARLQTRDAVEDQQEDTGARLVACEHKPIPTGEDGSKKYSTEMSGTSRKWLFLNELKFAAPMQPPNPTSTRAKRLCLYT